MNRKQREQLAQQTLEILEAGSYGLPDGQRVDLSPALAAAVAQTRLYRPADFPSELLRSPRSVEASRVEVTGETTLEAAERVVREQQPGELLCLNFASAKNPGGGFLSGSQAQEESLARSSGLYACLQGQMEAYEYHRQRSSAFYSDHMIYSPGVPVFRDDTGGLLVRPYRVTFLSAPAVNAGAVHRNEPERAGEIEAVMRTRLERLLWVAQRHGHQTLILGAWGCGVFGNEPDLVARLFSEQLLGSGPFAGRFARLVFAVYDRTESQEVISAFQRRLLASPD